MLADVDFATAFLDDSLIKSKYRDHVKHVIEVFKRIKEFGFRLILGKSDYFYQKSNIWEQ